MVTIDKNNKVISSNIDKVIIEDKLDDIILLKIEEDRNLQITLKEQASASILTYNNGIKDLKLNLEVKLMKGAIVNIYNVITSNHNVLIQEDCYLDGNNSECNNINVILMMASSTLDSNINIYHNVGDTHSRLENYAIAKDEAEITLNNNATIKHGAAKSIAMQKAKGLTLNEKAKIKAMPNLFIDEYDVIANHAVSIGSLNKDDLFYLMSRGLTTQEASKVLIMGFIYPLLDQINDEETKKLILKDFTKKLEN